jgi:hypothetical protein
MSEFLIVIPSGWTQLDWETVFNHPMINLSIAQEWIATRQFEYMTTLLIEAGALSEGQNVMEAKIIDGAYFLVQLG